MGSYFLLKAMSRLFIGRYFVHPTLVSIESCQLPHMIEYLEIVQVYKKPRPLIVDLSS